MSGGGDQGMRGRRPIAVALMLCALLSLAGLSTVAEAKKKKKSKPVATTRTAAASLAAGVSATSTANCKGKTHATGGGYAVAPNFVPPSTGLRTLPTLNSPLGNKGWTASAAAYTNPASSGQLITYARCEKNRAGKIAIRVNSSLALPSATGQNLVFNCPPGTHAISGGFAGDGPTALNSLATFRIIVVQSRRTGPGQWTVTGYNRSGAPTSTLTGYAVCEFNAKGASVSEASAFTQVANDARTSGQATCSKKKHVVSGGFLVSPLPPGTVPVIGVDETQPVGSRAWHVGLHEFPTFGLPPGSALQTFAYCKKGR
jgi:hypothetical protein